MDDFEADGQWYLEVSVCDTHVVQVLDGPHNLNIHAARL